MRADTIDSAGGMRPWLNSEAQRQLHNGHDFTRLLQLIAKPPGGLGWSLYGAAKEFNVVERTMYHWKTRLIKEGYLTKDGKLNPAPRTH